MRRWGLGLSVAVLVGGLTAFRFGVPARGLEAVGPLVLLDSLFALGLLLYVLLITEGVGQIELRLLGLVDSSSPLERLVLGSAMGLGTLAAGNAVLAVFGWLTLPGMLLWLGALSAAAALDERDFPARLHRLIRVLREWWLVRPAGEKLGLPVALALLACGLLMALVPTWDYDGLMYHLQAPRLLLDGEPLKLFPDLWQANGPLSIQMIYAFGLSLGSDAFAKLIHLWFGVLLILATAALAGRVLGKDQAWLAGLVMLGIPTLPFWASAAYVDVAWAAFETLTILALVVWAQERSPRWLLAGGACLGMALGTKSLALLLVPIAGMLIISVQQPRNWLRDLAIFLLPAVCIGGPWYLKNLLLAGNPLYPLVWGGPEWPAERVALLEAYLQGFGMGRRAVDYLLLPVRIFTHPASFGTFARAIEFPSFLFVLAPAYTPVWRSRIPRMLGGVVLLRFVMWALGSQQTRFLLPVFPCLAVLAAGAISSLTRRWSGSRWKRGLPVTVVLTSLLGVLGFSVAVPAVLRFHDVVLGRESKADFLRRVAGDYRAVEFIQTTIPSGSNVLLMWDGRGFYCDGRCVPDAEQSRWTWYVEQGEDVAGVATLLEEEGIDYLLHSSGDARFILEHDPTGANRRAQEFFLSQFRWACTRPLSLNPATEVYEITCRGDT